MTISSHQANYLSFDIMSDVVFGARYHLLTSPRFRYVVECIEASNVRMSALIQAPWYAALKLDKYLFRGAIKARNRFIKFVSRAVKDRMDKAIGTAASSKHPAKTADEVEEAGEEDVFARLESAKDPETGSGFRLDEIAAESTTLIVAGSDTTSAAMSTVAFYLAHNADAYAKAAAEVRAAFTSPGDVRMGQALVSCTYLRASIDEAMRMSPPVGSSLWREVVAPSGSITIDGQTIPSGTDVGVGIYALHHKAEYFPEPFAYSPERWLSENRESVDAARAAFNPFSIGMRSCLGKGIAQTELLLTFARILVAGDFRIASGELGKVGKGCPGLGLGRDRANEYQLWDHVTGQKIGPWLQFAKRAS
jgi:cytochrome P450